MTPPFFFAGIGNRQSANAYVAPTLRSADQYTKGGSMARPFSVCS